MRPLLAVLLLSACGWAVADEPDPTCAAVRGVFAFAQSPHFGAGAMPPLEAPDASGVLAVVERDYVAGLTYYVAWGDLEPAEGEYRWELIDEVLEAVAARGKVLNLGIFSRDAPAWLENRDGLRRITQSFQRHGSGQRITRERVFPLEDEYLEAYFRMVSALATHRVGGDGPSLKDHPSLGYVAVGGPSNGSGLETFLQVNPDQAALVRQWIEEATGDADWTAGLARYWRNAVLQYREAFPGKALAVALSFGLETGRPQDRTAAVAEAVHSSLRVMDCPPAVMTLNLTGAEWWYPAREGRNAPRRILGLLEESARSGQPVGLQMIGISAASRDAEARARPFDLALRNARALGADWVEIWVEDLLRERGAIPARRPWVSPSHPWFERLENEVRDFEKMIAR
jgi:hypothetical protein